MPTGSEYPELRKTASQNLSPPMWDSADPLRRPQPLPKNTNPDLHPVGTATSPTKVSPTKSFTPSSVHRRLNSLQTQSSSNVRELSHVFNNQIGPSKPTNGISPGPFKNESPVGKKDRDRDISTVSIPPMFGGVGGVKSKGEVPLSRPPAPAYDAPAMVPNVAASTHMPASVSLATSNISPDRFSSAIGSGDFHILSGQLSNLLTISNSLQKEMANLSRRSKDNAMDLMSLKEATNNRDEDIRKSLKDLASGLTRPGGRLALTANNDTLDFDNALTRYGSAPDIHRSFVSDAEEVLRKSHDKRKSIGKDIQATVEGHSTDRIIREMATKENQRRITDILEHLQNEVLAQGKTATSKFSEVLRNIQSAGLRNASPNAVVRFNGQTQDTENDNGVILDLLEVMKTSMEERMDDLQNSLSLINNTPSSGSGAVDISRQLKPVEEALYSHIQTTEEVKSLISNLQVNVAGASLSPPPMLENLSSQIQDLTLKIQALPAGPNASAAQEEEGVVTTIELKDMLKTLIEMASRNEAGTYKAVEVLMQKLGELSASTSRDSTFPLADGSEGAAAHTDSGLQPVLASLRVAMGEMQGDICAQEKVVEKALEIILRELNKLSPVIESKIPAPDVIACATQSNLQEDFGKIQMKIATVEGTVRDSMNVIQTQLQVITESASTQLFAPRPEGKEGESAPPPRPHFDGSVAAVSAIGAMGKDLKHTMENLQSDINGREKVTEKAMEIILREIGTINKSVSSVPSKVVDGIRDALHQGGDMKQTMQELQADVLGREKHTEKALEIILRELQTVAANFDKAQLAIAHSQEQKANIVGQAEKDIKFNLETIVTRSNRIADTTASIQELLETFETTQTEASNATQKMVGSFEASIKAPIDDLNVLLKSVQEQFKSTTSNTAQSIIEVAKYLDTLGEKATANAEQIGSIKTYVSTVQENMQGFDTTNKELNGILLKKLESMVVEIQESNMRAIESSRTPVEEELAQEKEANSKVISELKALIDSLKEGFTQSVVTTETRNSELSTQLDSYCQSAREDQQQTQNDIKSVKDSVLSLQSDDGTLAKILLAMKDVAEYLAKTSTTLPDQKRDEEQKENQENMDVIDNHKLDEILKNMLTKEDAKFTEILESMLTKEDSKFTEILNTMLTKEDSKFTEILDTMLTKEDSKFSEILESMMTKNDPILANIQSTMLTKDDPKLTTILESMATKDDLKFTEVLDSMLKKEDHKLSEIHSSMLTKDDSKLVEIYSSMLTKEDPKLSEIQSCMVEISERIKSLTELKSTTPEDNSGGVKDKLETLINHSNHQAKFFSQMSLLGDIQQKIEGTSVQVSEFIASQTTLLQTSAATERHEAAEATLAKEKALAEKSIAEAVTVALKAEEVNLQNSISSLKFDSEDLSKRKQQLSAELSSIETALALRREELALLEARAESLERRMVEGVINQSRSLLLAKSASAPAKPLRRIVNPPVTGAMKSTSGPPGRRIASMNITNIGASQNSMESQTRTPSGSSLFTGSPSSIRRAQSVRTSAHTSRKTSWSATEHAVQHDDNSENKENAPRDPPVISNEEPLTVGFNAPLIKVMPDTGLATLDTIEDDDTDNEELVDKATVFGSSDAVRGEKRYPSSLSISSERRDSISSGATVDEEVD